MERRRKEVIACTQGDERSWVHASNGAKGREGKEAKEKKRRERRKRKKNRKKKIRNKNSDPCTQDRTRGARKKTK
jgi:hypothetical protein